MEGGKVVPPVEDEGNCAVVEEGGWDEAFVGLKGVCNLHDVTCFRGRVERSGSASHFTAATCLITGNADSGLSWGRSDEGAGGVNGKGQKDARWMHCSRINNFRKGLRKS